MTSAEWAELGRIVRESLIPALQQEAGFSGALGMVEPGTGRVMMIALWEHEEQATAPPAQRGDAVRRALMDIELLSDRATRSISVWKIDIEL